MRSKYKFIFASLIFLCLVVSMGAASADDLDTIQEGEVSGGVDVAYSNPGVENGELSYDIPEDVQNVQYAGLFVDCYTAGSSNTVYGSEANVSVTSNGETEQIANEMLVSTQGSQDGTVYAINDHTTKCYADYYMTYNLTEMLQGASGKVTINVKTGALEGYEYYNKIKLIGLVFAYDDGDSDKICYWVNSGSSWIKGDSTDTSKATFDVGTIGCEISKATLDNFALSSIDGLYSFNGKELEESTAYDEGVYYFKYHQWDVLDKISNSTNTLVYTPGAGAFSFRNTLSLLTVTKHTPAVSVKLGSEYSGAVFAGTNNVLKLDLTNKGESDTVYVVDFYVDGVKVSSTEIQLNEGLSSSTYLVDDLIRPVTAETVNGVSTTKVNYTVIVSDKDTGEILNESTITPTLWYNGNLGKDLAYPAENITSFNNITVNGDIIIDTKTDSTYMGATATNRTDVWNLDVPEDAQFVNGFIYVSYNWDKSGQTVPPFTATFNGVAVTPVATYRDQSNMGNYGKYGYGLIVYDVSGLLVKGENTFVLEKEFNKTAVYPSTLVALYNVSNSAIEKTIYMYNGADLLSNANNFLGRIVASNNVLDIDSIENIVGSSLYVFAASAQAGEGNLIVNDASYDNVWSGSSNSVGQYIVDLGTAPSESNTVSFVATGSTILALQQFIVVESATPKASDLQKLIDETPAGGVLDLGSKVFADVSDINITKDISIVGDNAFIITAGDGKPVFNIASDVNNVSISGLNFVANNGDVLIKATATNGTDDLSINNPAISIANNTVTKANDNVVASSITLFELESERGVLAPSNPIDIKDNDVVDGAKTFDFEIAGLNDGSGINIPQGGSINTNGTSSVKVATTIVAKAMTTTTVNTKINGKNAGKNFAITLKDSNGNVLANKQVMISLDGKIYKCTTNANGVATVKIALSKKGTYPVVVSFLGDDKYNGSFAVAKVKVNPQKVKLTVTKKTYKASKKTKYLYATLKATNKKAIKGKKLVFTVNGKKYTAKTNAKGIAKIKVKLSKKKTYKVTVKFAGDNTFKKITKKGKVVIK